MAQGCGQCQWIAGRGELVAEYAIERGQQGIAARGSGALRPTIRQWCQHAVHRAAQQRRAAADGAVGKSGNAARARGRLRPEQACGQAKHVRVHVLGEVGGSGHGLHQ